MAKTTVERIKDKALKVRNTLLEEQQKHGLTFPRALESWTKMALSEGRRRPWSCLDLCRGLFLSLMIGSAKKSFSFYLIQGGCPNNDISGVSGEGLGKKRQKACPQEQSKRSGVRKALER